MHQSSSLDHVITIFLGLNAGRPSMSTVMLNLRGFAGLFDRLVPSLVRHLQTKAASRPVPPHTGDV